jgi:adenosylcobinamide amidohydrolase
MAEGACFRHSAEVCYFHLRQVSWLEGWQSLADRFTFPSIMLSGLTKRIPCSTVAGPRRYFTGFPFQALRPPEIRFTLYHNVRNAMPAIAHAEELLVGPEFHLVRNGRFLVMELLTPHRTLSTSSRNGGQSETLRFLVNHQSCEGTDHKERHTHISELGPEAYHDAACLEINLDPNAVAMMGTAANMNYAAVVQHSDAPLMVTAVVTAGVHGNAACAGDPAAWKETEKGWQKIAEPGGTINTMLLLNHSVTAGALARSVVTMTEAKSAALQRLAVRSLYSREFATGTGTDQYCVAAPLTNKPPLTSTSPHAKLGELIGTAVRDATMEALRWQNGLEPSTTRFLFHALNRFGIQEKTFLADIAPRLTERELDLLKKNFNSVVYEPKVAAAAFSIASVLDRIRYGTLPASAARDVFRQHAATLAASLSAKTDRWQEFFAQLSGADPENPAPALLHAIALGWSLKWR